MIEAEEDVYSILDDISGNNCLYVCVRDNGVQQWSVLKNGEYKKTKDPVPDQKVLDYNVWKAEKDKLQAYKEKTENQPHTSKFEEMADAQGWK